MNNKNRLLIIDLLSLMILIVIDQLSKIAAVIYLKNKPAIPLLDGILELQYLENKGAAFGMLQNQKLFFIMIAVVILGVICYVLFKTPDQKKYSLLHVLLVLIASGAIGNMIDRLVRNYVVDFIYFRLIDFPIFNVADIYVSCATAFLIVAVLFYYTEADFNFLNLKQNITRTPQYTDIKDLSEKKDQ